MAQTRSPGRNTPRVPLVMTLSRLPGAFPIVGVGASAGGLDAAKTLFGSMPSVTGMAFILVLHLDPTHESMMVDLLVGQTLLTVKEAIEGMTVERECLYVIPPGFFLSVGAGVLHLSQPKQRHGSRLPFDFLLGSLVKERGSEARCIVLSGTGADGSVGAKAIKAAGGLVFVQDPDEARYDGMPRNVIATGTVDKIRPVAGLVEALTELDRGMIDALVYPHRPGPKVTIGVIVDLLRARTSHDFSSYKKGTVQRRIERRMALAGLESGDIGGYYGILYGSVEELDLLAKDLLIHVTSFFRDADVFAILADETVPSLLNACAKERSLRIWVVGCSTGEETYSLAMLFRERILAEKIDIKLQIFASDIDPEAVTKAREGVYATTIERDVSAERLARFFSRDDFGYRVSPDLRASIVFTVHDVLADPPFARLDMISCRNVLIYLDIDAQTKVMGSFHFALKEEGILLLGNAETVGRAKDNFAIVAKAERLYRKLGNGRAMNLGFLSRGYAVKTGPRKEIKNAKVPQPILADVCRRSLLETYAPAAVLINAKNECVYHQGPTKDYLNVASGDASHDLLDMVRKGARTTLRSAIKRVRQDGSRIFVTGGRMMRDGISRFYEICVQPSIGGGDEILLVCFIDGVELDRVARDETSDGETGRIKELERELDVTRGELHGAIRELETSGEDQKAINEEALSFNEEYQSTNEELITSKEELQSFNEELAALNGQLQDTRQTTYDLQNVLYSTDVATLFLDTESKIRFFTPATRSLFNLIPGDIGRPLDDLHALAVDERLPSDIQVVLRSQLPVEREIEGRGGIWFIRRILPYRAHNGSVEGVVITFTDITERKHDAVALEAAKQQAEHATLAKSRFLAAASHDLRQPLQTLSLIHGLLTKTVEGDSARRLVNGFAETLAAMNGMLDSLLDVNQIEAGTVRPALEHFPIVEILDRLKDEFAYQAEAYKLSLRVVRCGQDVISDRHLLEQMIRNLLSNALKYTLSGKVLLGCRRLGKVLRIEIWDTGTGISEPDLGTIFAEYHQLDNASRDRSGGLGLGLSIVNSLSHLLGHPVHVRSVPGKGSVFTVDVNRYTGKKTTDLGLGTTVASGRKNIPHRLGRILIVEDDKDIRDLLTLFLTQEGHRVAAASDASAALGLVMNGDFQPDLILADYNLPGEMNGLNVASDIQAKLEKRVPVIILTGDISTGALRSIANHDCVKLNKPVRPSDLILLIRDLLSNTTTPVRIEQKLSADQETGTSVVFIVDDDDTIRRWIRDLFEDAGYVVRDYRDGESFLASFRSSRNACLLIDACLPGMSGRELLAALHDAGHTIPAIMITGKSDVAMAVEAMKAGAADFIEKPVSASALLAGVRHALERSHDTQEQVAWTIDAASKLAALTPRQLQIMDLVLAGSPSKNIAFDLGISQRTVENHRASIMKRTGSKSLPALARLALAASGAPQGVLATER